MNKPVRDSAAYRTGAIESNHQKRTLLHDWAELVRPGAGMNRIMVLTEDTQARKMIRAALENPECEILEPQDPAYALELLRNQTITCMLVDCSLTGVHRKMLHLLQYSAGMASVPVLWLSNYGARDPLLRELQLSPLNVLHKPFTPLQLLEKVQYSLWLGPCASTDTSASVFRSA